MTVTEDVPVMARPQPRAAPGRSAAWWWLVAACAAILVVVAATLAVWWAASRETRTTSYRVLGDLAGIRLDLGVAPGCDMMAGSADQETEFHHSNRFLPDGTSVLMLRRAKVAKHTG